MIRRVGTTNSASKYLLQTRRQQSSHIVYSYSVTTTTLLTLAMLISFFFWKKKRKCFQLFLNTGMAQEVKIIPFRRQAPIYLNMVTDNQIREYQQSWYLKVILEYSFFSTLRSEQIVSHFADHIIECIFLRKNVCVFILVSLKFIPRGSVGSSNRLVCNRQQAIN